MWHSVVVSLFFRRKLHSICFSIVFSVRTISHTQWPYLFHLMLSVHSCQYNVDDTRKRDFFSSASFCLRGQWSDVRSTPWFYKCNLCRSFVMFWPNDCQFFINVDNSNPILDLPLFLHLDLSRKVWPHYRFSSCPSYLFYFFMYLDRLYLQVHPSSLFIVSSLLPILPELTIRLNKDTPFFFRIRSCFRTRKTIVSDVE